ncbi:BTB/POZ domain-containing protein KCTD6-like [Amphiura filiformis]|uniref:BTB/POZ domain-containing protein KCTD6-like n=1 Tax=Amphiura filiformis TaxID=82378 RepID=UPI003B21B562
MADVVTLSVGGTVYTTSAATLNRFPDSTLGRLMRQTKQPVAPMTETPIDFEIDRDGSLFRHILGYIRNNKLLLPNDFAEIDALKVEAAYYDIPNLITDIEQWQKKKHLTVEERVFVQSGTGRQYNGTFVDWTAMSEDRAPILWLAQVGVFVANQAKVTIGDDGRKIHRCWYDGIKVGNDYALPLANLSVRSTKSTYWMRSEHLDTS